MGLAGSRSVLLGFSKESLLRLLNVGLPNALEVVLRMIKLSVAVTEHCVVSGTDFGYGFFFLIEAKWEKF